MGHALVVRELGCVECCGLRPAALALTAAGLSIGRTA